MLLLPAWQRYSLSERTLEDYHWHQLHQYWLWLCWAEKECHCLKLGLPGYSQKSMPKEQSDQNGAWSMHGKYNKTRLSFHLYIPQFKRQHNYIQTQKSYVIYFPTFDQAKWLQFNDIEPHFILIFKNNKGKILTM